MKAYLMHRDRDFAAPAEVLPTAAAMIEDLGLEDVLAAMADGDELIREVARRAFLAAVNDTPLTPLGVADFGQSGDVEDLYRHFGIDTETIVGAAIDLLP